MYVGKKGSRLVNGSRKPELPAEALHQLIPSKVGIRIENYVYELGSKSTSGGQIIHQQHHLQHHHHGSSVVLAPLHHQQLHQHYEDMKHELGESDDHDLSSMPSKIPYFFYF